MRSFSQNAVNEYLALRVSYTGRRLFGGMTTCQGDNNEHTSLDTCGVRTGAASSIRQLR
jgi:hypothetical protein